MQFKTAVFKSQVCELLPGAHVELAASRDHAAGAPGSHLPSFNEHLKTLNQPNLGAVVEVGSLDTV